MSICHTRVVLSSVKFHYRQIVRNRHFSFHRLAVILTCNSDETHRERKKWSKDWYSKQEVYGHVNLLTELRANEPEDYRNFLRLDEIIDIRLSMKSD